MSTLSRAGVKTGKRDRKLPRMAVRLFNCQKTAKPDLERDRAFFSWVGRMSGMVNRIEINPHIHHGQPVIKGTRTLVTRVLAEVAAGTSFDQIQRPYDLTDEDIRAAVAFANELVGHQAVIPTFSVSDKD